MRLFYINTHIHTYNNICKIIKPYILRIKLNGCYLVPETMEAGYLDMDSATYYQEKYCNFIQNLCTYCRNVYI